jgi:hypothetical protein
MAIPASRDQLKEHCLRRLGKPVVDINVDDEQVEDRIDEALLYYRDYHFDGTERVYLKQQVTDEDKTNGYFTLDNSIIGVTSVFDIGDAIQSSNLFNIRYQIHLNDLFDFSSTTYVPYVTAMRHVEQLEEIFVGKKPIRFNRHINRLHIDMDWDDDVKTGNFVIIDAYKITDPEVYSDVWADRWLLTYTTALIKRQWGENLKKFEGLQMPGGLTFNGQKIWEESTEEIRRLEEEMINSYSLPVMDMSG